MTQKPDLIFDPASARKAPQIGGPQNPVARHDDRDFICATSLPNRLGGYTQISRQIPVRAGFPKWDIAQRALEATREIRCQWRKHQVKGWALGVEIILQLQRRFIQRGAAGQFG